MGKHTVAQGFGVRVDVVPWHQKPDSALPWIAPFQPLVRSREEPYECLSVRHMLSITGQFHISRFLIRKGSMSCSRNRHASPSQERSLRFRRVPEYWIAQSPEPRVDQELLAL